MSSLTKKMGKKQQAQQLVGLLGALAPNLQQVQGQMQQMVDLAPELQKAQDEWAQQLTGLRRSLSQIEARVEQTRSVLLVLIYEQLGKPGQSMEAFLERAAKLEAEYAGLTGKPE